MKAAVLKELGKPLEVAELSLPSLKEGQVLLSMHIAAVCHSQKLEVSGGRGPGRFLPHLIGHEGVGVVTDVGPQVKKVRAGDQVVVSWIRGTGLPGGPIQYGSPFGTVNAGPIATFCTTPIVAEQCVTPIRPSVDPDAAVLAGCAIPTGAGTVWNAMPPKADGAVCILGLGGVGLTAICAAAASGWGTVAGADLKPLRLERARQLGATHTIDAGKENLEEAAKKITGGSGFDLVLECAGASASMEAAIKIARTGGGKVVIVGNLAAGKTIQIDPFDLIKGRWLSGSWGGWIDPDKDIPRIVRLSLEGKFNHKLLAGKPFDLDQVNEAIRSLDEENPGRPIIRFGS